MLPTEDKDLHADAFPATSGAWRGWAVPVFDRSGGYLLLVVFLCLMSIWAVFGVTLVSSYRHDREEARGYGNNVVALLASDIGRNFETYDLSLKALVASLSDPAVMHQPPAQRHRSLFDRSTDGSIFGSMFAVNADGILTMESRSLVPQNIDVTDRDYFKVFKQGVVSTGLFLSHPYRGRLSGEWMVGVSRRVTGADGSFAGVAAGALKLGYFVDLFGSVRLPAGSRVELRYDDGGLLVDETGAMSALGRPQRDVGLTRLLEGDGELVVARKVPGLPLIQSVGLPMSAVMEDFWWRTLTTASTFMFLSFALVLLAAVLGRELRRRSLAEATLATLAATDALTGLSNRRRFDEVFQAEFRRSSRTAAPLSLLVIDVDHFKRFNDAYGHTAGDAALRMVAKVCRDAGVRSSDLAARVGGEEFAVLLSGTGIAGAGRVAERIAEGIRDQGVPHVGSPHGFVTVSIGVGCHRKGALALSPKELFDDADAALYRAKAGGRARVELSVFGAFGRDRESA